MTFVQINKGNSREKLMLSSHFAYKFYPCDFFFLLATFIHSAVLLDILHESWIAVITASKVRS